MVFTTHLFVFYFLPTVLLLYYLLPFKARTGLLALCSYAFYGWANPWWAVLMFLSSGVDYICGLVLAKQAGLLRQEDRKSTRLNSSHSQISYAVFRLKQKDGAPAHPEQPLQNARLLGCYRLHLLQHDYPDLSHVDTLLLVAASQHTHTHGDIAQSHDQ